MKKKNIMIFRDYSDIRFSFRFLKYSICLLVHVEAVIWNIEVDLILW